MVIDHTPQYREIWDAVYQRLGFSPSYADSSHALNGHLPFQIAAPHAVYAVEHMPGEKLNLLEQTVREIFCRITKPGRRIYALDWQHSAFLYDPCNPDEQTSCAVRDERYPGGGYTADFPAFYPDGDYYFFLEEQFEFGYLGHPWRQEIWVFGRALMEEIERVYQKFGWDKLK